MSDQRIRHLFDQLDSEPSAEFEASLRRRVLGELTTPAASASGEPPNTDQENIIMLTIDPPEASPRGRSHKRLYGALLASAAAVVALFVTGVIVTRDDTEPASPPTTPVPQPTVPPPTTVTPQTTAPPTTAPTAASLPELDVPTPAPVPAPAALSAGVTIEDGRIFQVKFDGFNLWATGADSTALLRIDPATGSVEEPIDLPSPATEDPMEAHDGRLYVITYGGIVIVNGETTEVSPPGAVGDGFAMSVAFTNDSAWVLRTPFDGAAERMNTLEQWDLGLTVMRRSVDVGEFHTGGMVGVDESLFISTDDRGLLHYDDAGSLVATIPDVGYSFDLGASAGSVWVPDYDTGELHRIDPATDEIVATIPINGIGAHSVIATDTSVWVTTWQAGNVSAVDPATDLRTVQTHVGQGPTSLALVDGVVWVAGDGYVHSFIPG